MGTERPLLAAEDEKFIERSRKSSNRISMAIVIIILLWGLGLVLLAFKTSNSEMIFPSAMMFFLSVALLGHMLNDQRWVKIVDKLVK